MAAALVHSTSRRADTHNSHDISYTFVHSEQLQMRVKRCSHTSLWSLVHMRVESSDDVALCLTIGILATVILATGIL